MPDIFQLLTFVFAGALLGLGTRYIQMNNAHWHERAKLVAVHAKEMLDREDKLRTEFAEERGKLLDRIQSANLTEYKTVGPIPDKIQAPGERPDVSTDEKEMEYLRALGLEPPKE